MPQPPHPIRGIIYDENSLVKDGVMVTVTNFRTDEGTNVTTNTAGEYILDLANLPSGYEDKDILLLQAYINEPPEKYDDATLTCDTSVDEQTQNLTLKLILPIHSIRKVTDMELKRTIFSPTSRAFRVLLVDEDGTPKDLTKIGNDSTYFKADIVNNELLCYVNGNLVKRWRVR